MQIKPIRSDKDHAAALLEVERLWGAKRGTPDGDKLDVLITLVEAYERERFPIDTPDPIEAIRFRLEQQGKDLRSLIGVIGQRTRVYEVMRRDRPLSLAMIRRLHEKLGIPAEVLIYAGRRAHRKQSAAKVAKSSRQSA
jgi:HTH-type transcriptional regulator/antitoxin HigA